VPVPGTYTTIVSQIVFGWLTSPEARLACL
jgi:hypothetical protein